MQNKEKIRLGRDLDSDIRISDISLSRCHALISFEDNKFYIRDNYSKFGTLVMLKNPILVDTQSNGFNIQIGKTIMTITIKKKFNLLSYCICKKYNRTDDYDLKLPSFFNNCKINY